MKKARRTKRNPSKGRRNPNNKGKGEVMRQNRFTVGGGVANYPLARYNPLSGFTTQQNWYGNLRTCKPHQEWLQIGCKGKEEYEVFLKSMGGHIHKDVDVFISLTATTGGLVRRIPNALKKYLPPKDLKPSLVVWEINDGEVDLILPEFVLNLLRAGFKVGWGCIGGHGRTGWLAAKVHQMITECTGDEAVAYVREHYCENAIETVTQLNDLGCEESEVAGYGTRVTYYY